MDEQAASRRTFLKQAGLAAPILTQLLAARRSFAEDLSSVEDQANARPATNVRPSTNASPFSRLHTLYGLAPEVTYFNHASVGTIPFPVQKAQRRYLDICESNPWLHMWGGAWEEPREEVRRKAGHLLRCQDDEITFSHNTTETFNMLAQGLPLGRGDEVLMSSLNHTGASACWEHAAETRHFQVRRFDFPVLDTPRLTRDDILNLHDEHITRRTRVLVFPHVDNTVGLRHPVRELASLARSRGVRYIAVDAAQTVGMLPLDVASLGVDVYATSAHKWLQAPKGLGLAYIRHAIQSEVRPFWVTWGQERWRGTARAFEDYGTRNLAEVLTLGDAMDFQRVLGEDAKEQHHRALWQHARAAVEASPKLEWRSPSKWEMSAPLYAMEVRGEKSQDVFQRLFRDHGYIFRPFATDQLNTIRLSPNVANTMEEIDRLVEILG